MVQVCVLWNVHDLRIQDIDFDYQQITVREAKGNKQRVVPLPEKLIPIIHSHISQV